MKRWWGRLEKRWVATESGGDETGGPSDETSDTTAATAGDEGDGSNRSVYITSLVVAVSFVTNR